MKYLRIFIVSNATVIAAFLFLPAFLVTGDISVIEEMINSISKE